MTEVFFNMTEEHRQLTDSQLTAFRSLLTSQLLKLVDIFRRNNFEIRIVGGAVRDILTDKAPKDIDLATTATPEQMMEMFDACADCGVRTIIVSSEKHGTVTVRIDDTENYEVSTLRIDKNQDERQSGDVNSRNDWKWISDAGRRDLTVNSVFLGRK